MGFENTLYSGSKGYWAKEYKIIGVDFQQNITTKSGKVFDVQVKLTCEFEKTGLNNEVEIKTKDFYFFHNYKKDQFGIVIGYDKGSYDIDPKFAKLLQLFKLQLRVQDNGSISDEELAKLAGKKFWCVFYKVKGEEYPQQCDMLEITKDKAIALFEKYKLDKVDIDTGNDDEVSTKEDASFNYGANANSSQPIEEESLPW